ncbi:MAG: hypothetical protein AAF235_00040 [Planctomycetota bacterium]
MLTNRKGVQDIKSHAGRPTSPGAEHRLYIRLSTLEMERSRREQEFEGASARAELARSRVVRLEQEIQELVAKISERYRVAPAAAVTERIESDAQHMHHTYGAVPRSGSAAKGATT